MFICEKNYSCCNYQYWDKQEDVESEAKECGHLIEVVPMVRCKDCANKERPNGVHLWCYEHKRYVAPDDFCSYGE